MIKRHELCRRALKAARNRLSRRLGYTKIEMWLETMPGGYKARNVYGLIWAGKACCKWRARAKAIAKAIKAVEAKRAGGPNR